MNRAIKLVGAAVVLAVFGGALWFSLRGHQNQVIEQQAAQAQLAVESAPAMNGWVAVDVEPYFADARVQKILRERGVAVQAKRLGSRDMAAKLGDADKADFYFPSGVLAANQIAEEAKKLNINAVQSSPFNSPMVVASWAPIAKILEANGIAKPTGERIYALSMDKLLEVMQAKKRWVDLKASEAYPVKRGVLVSTTDVRKSNSAAMYLALTSHALLGDVVTDHATAASTAEKLAGLFKRQGYQENYVNGNFDDYVQIGIGKAPLAFIYEYQIVGYALRNKGIQPDMVLLYPEPTIVNKFVMLATSERGKALQTELSSNAELQKIAVEYGLRVGDAGLFTAAVKPSGLVVQERLQQVIDPPAFDLMSEMVDVLTREMAK